MEFDGVNIEKFEVSPEEIEEAFSTIDPELLGNNKKSQGKYIYIPHEQKRKATSSSLKEKIFF